MFAVKFCGGLALGTISGTKADSIKKFVDSFGPTGEGCRWLESRSLDGLWEVVEVEIVQKKKDE